MTPLDLLTEAQKLISDPAHWTRGTYARNAEGEPCTSLAPEAICFCSLGATRRAFHNAFPDPDMNNFRILSQAENFLALGSGSVQNIVTVNDSTNYSHADVMAVWDKAKELAAA